MFASLWLQLGTGGEPHDVVLGHLCAADLTGNAPLSHDEDPVRHTDYLLQLRTDHQNAEPTRRQLPHDPVDFRFRANIHTSGRLVEDQHAVADTHPAADQYLLLVPTRKRGNAAAWTRAGNAIFLDR